MRLIGYGLMWRVNTHGGHVLQSLVIWRLSDLCQSLPSLLPPKNNVTAGTAWHVLVISVVLGIWDVLSA